MDKRSKVFSNLIWRFFERGGSQLVSFAVSIVLARILDPATYGTVSKVLVITAVMLVFVDSGMANALIQKKDPDDLDFSSVFYFNICFCLVLYVLLFFTAPWIAVLYKDTGLTPLVRVLGLTLIFSGLKNVQQAYVSKTMQFRRFFFATLGGTLFSAVLGITMAYRGFGVWALVAQQISNVAVNTAILWFTVGWKPKRMFSWQRLTGLLQYGWKLLVASLIDQVYIKIYPLVIGIRYTSEDIAFYEKGMNWPNLIVENINNSMDSVLLPVLSAEQDQKDRVREMTRRAIKTGTYIIMPLMAGLAACATPLVRLLMTEKWLPSVPYLQIFCIIYAFFPLHTANLNAIKAMGRSDIFLILEIVKRGLELVILLITMRYGVFAMVIGLLLSELASQGINAFPNRKLLDYPYWQQLKDMLPAILLSLAMAAVVYPICLLGFPDWLTLLIQIPLGVLIYVLGSKILKLESFTYLLSAAKTMLNKRKAG
ncbi:MAG: lipopolysaccharide biosynthesis protein [Oscillospiraceae bacterium]|nr:lipopolysaccharide biosynthesis protein [Oscillospiraceae bacterium]